MEQELDDFIEFIRNEKHMSVNTEMSYRRDLLKLCKYEAEHGVFDVKQITQTNLTSFILFLEEKGFSPATISRTIASVKAFISYLAVNKKIDGNITLTMKAPKIEKKKQHTLSFDEIFKLLEQPDESTFKGMRDKAMLELLYATGIRVTQLISLEMDDINLKLGYIKCNQQTIQISREAQRSLAKYITEARSVFVKNNDSCLVFFNCSGTGMSRQGFWKMLKNYAKQAGIESEITPHSIRNSMK